VCDVTLKSASSVTLAKGAIRKYKGHIRLGGHLNLLKKYTWYVPSRSCHTEVEISPDPAKQEACTAALAFATATASLAFDDCAKAALLKATAIINVNNFFITKLLGYDTTINILQIYA